MRFIKEFVKAYFGSHLPRWFVWGTFLLAVGGAMNAFYLFTEHLQNHAVLCPAFTPHCNFVLQSRYAEIFSIPVALLGLVYYLLILLILGLKNRVKQRHLIILLTAITGAGFLFSLWLVCAQLYIINAICAYCMLSAVISILLFVLDVILMIKISRESKLSEVINNHL